MTNNYHQENLARLKVLDSLDLRNIERLGSDSYIQSSTSVDNSQFYLVNLSDSSFMHNGDLEFNPSLEQMFWLGLVSGVDSKIALQNLVNLESQLKSLSENVSGILSQSEQTPRIATYGGFPTTRNNGLIGFALGVDPKYKSNIIDSMQKDHIPMYFIAKGNSSPDTLSETNGIFYGAKIK